MRMATLGLNEDQARAVADMLTTVETATEESAFEVVEAGKEKARQRWRNWRERNPANASKRLPTAANASKHSRDRVTRVEDKTLTTEIEPQTKKETRASALSAFDEFWSAFPNKVGKPKARASFDKATRSTPPAAIMAGLQRYIASKPPDRPWLNPATFLNQERWTDQPATVAQARAGPQGVNLSHLFATQERMENAQQVEPSENPVRYLSAANG